MEGGGGEGRGEMEGEEGDGGGGGGEEGAWQGVGRELLAGRSAVTTAAP